MKQIVLIFILSLFSTAFWAQEYQLVWHDEFEEGKQPNPKKWSYEEGFIRNNEFQYYTKSRAKNARLKNGNLIIEARKESYPNKFFQKKTKKIKTFIKNASYTSASLSTKNKFSFTYGCVTVRAKLPAGDGVWPAIWMLGANFNKIPWPGAGEIDVMEFVGKEPDSLYSSLHYSLEEENKLVSQTQGFKIKNSASKFHVFKMIWTPEEISFYCDDIGYFSFPLKKAGSSKIIFQKDFYLKLNLALGGNWAGKVNDAALPQQFIIDYVRIFQLENKKAGL